MITEYEKQIILSAVQSGTLEPEDVNGIINSQIVAHVFIFYKNNPEKVIYNDTLITPVRADELLTQINKDNEKREAIGIACIKIWRIEVTE